MRALQALCSNAMDDILFAYCWGDIKNNPEIEVVMNAKKVALDKAMKKDVKEEN